MSMKVDFEWPKKGDHPFSGGTFDSGSPTWVDLQWLGAWGDDSMIALAFKEAGDKLIMELSRKRDYRHSDIFFMPIAYLYRHSLELKMKEIIRSGIRVGAIQNNTKVREALSRHELYKLWIYVRTIIGQFSSGTSRTQIGAIERVIQAFHEIDKAGQRFRYSKKLDGTQPAVALPKHVDLKRMGKVVRGVYNLLESCDSALGEI